MKPLRAGLIQTKKLGDPVPGSELVVPASMHHQPPTRSWSQDQIMQVAAHACEAAANCMVFRADAVSKAQLGAIIDGEFRPDHPLSQLFARQASVFFSPSDYLHQVMYTLDSDSGGAYVIGPLNAKGQPTSLWVRTSADVRPMPSKTGFIDAYEMRVDNVWRPIDPAKYVVWQHRFVPMDVHNLYGSWPPLHRAARAVRSFQFLGNFVEQLLRNKAIIDGFITNRDGADMDPDLAKIVDARVQDEYNGPQHAGGVRFLPGNLDFVKLGQTLSDVNPGEMEDRLEAKIAASFQLNPVSVRSYAAMKGSDSLGGDKIAQFIRQDYLGTISGLWQLLAGDVAVALAERYDLAPEQVGFDVSDVRELEEGADARFNRIRGVEAMSINQQLAELGLPPNDDPDADVPIMLLKLQAAAKVGEYAPIFAPTAPPAK